MTTDMTWSEVCDRADTIIRGNDTEVAQTKTKGHDRLAKLYYGHALKQVQEIELLNSRLESRIARNESFEAAIAKLSKENRKLDDYLGRRTVLLILLPGCAFAFGVFFKAWLGG